MRLQFILESSRPISQRLAFASVVTLGTYLSYSAYRRWRISCHMGKVRKEMRGKRRFDLDTLSKTLSSKRVNEISDEITSLSLTELQRRLQEGRLQARDVLAAYQYKALEVHEKTNCLTGTLKRADDLARDLDSLPTKMGPLHGVPVSVKDSISMQGYPNSWGCANLSENVAKEDAVLVQVLLNQGAVPFVRTGVSQLLMAVESDNPIYGAIKNPHNPGRGPGGSSGGEGALIAGGGSILGLGSDIGGSIRLPSTFCGICGFKPGTGRISNKFVSKPRGQTVVLPTLGPMARDVDGLVTMMRCLLVPDMYKLDPSIVPLKFREKLYKAQTALKIGFFEDDGYHRASPAVARAVQDAKAALERAGHTLVPWKPFMVSRAVDLQFRAITGDKGANWAQILKHDLVDNCITLITSLVFMSPIRRWLTVRFHRWMGQTKYADYINSCRGAANVPEWFNTTIEAELYRQEFIQDWKDKELDAVLGPSFAGVASKLGRANDVIRCISWTMIYNLLDFPAGVLPVTRVNTDDISRLSTFEPGEMAEWIKEDLEDAEGMPVCVQVAALRWQEETCLRVMKDIEEGVEYQ